MGIPRIGSLVAPLAILLIVGAGALALRALARSMMFPGSPLALPKEPGGFTALTYRTADGTPGVAAMVTATGAPASPFVLFFHGNAESAAHNLPFAIELSQHGVSAVLVEYRGFGGLAGRPTEAGLYQDGEAALAAVMARGVTPDRIVLCGRSLGSGIAVELASKHPCSLLVLVSPFTSTVDMGRSMVGPFAPLLVADRFDSAAKMASLRCPAVVLHGTNDEVVPFAMGKRLAAAGHARFVPLEGRGHNDIGPAELAELVAREMKAATAGRAPAGSTTPSR